MSKAFVFSGRKCLLAAIPLVLFSLAASYDLLIQRTEPIPLFNQLVLIARGVRFGLFVGAFALFLGRPARFLYVPLWTWFALVLLIQTFASVGFSTILDGCWLMIAAASSWQEVVGCIRMFSPSLLILACLAAGMVWLLGVRILTRKIYPRVTVWTWLLGVLLVVPFVALDMSSRTRVGAFDSLTTFHLPMDTFSGHRAYRQVVEAARCPQLPPKLRLAVPRASAPLGLVVVGESATRTDWGLYGYERPTTPRLSALSDELVVFAEPTSTHTFTSMSLQTIFTEATAERPNDARCLFAQKCAAVGYVCSLFSAQTRWGRWEGVEKLLFTGCDEKWYLNEQSTSRNGQPQYDDALVPPTLARARQASAERPALLFVHLMGSHFEPRERYPAARAVFPRYAGDYPPGLDASSSAWNIRACDEYDNSIAFTDAILGDLIEGLRALKRASYLVYFSDHGESPRARTWRTQQDPDLKKVPLVIWFSPEYRAQFPQVVADMQRRAASPIRLDHLQPVLLALAMIRTDDLVKMEDFGQVRRHGE